MLLTDIGRRLQSEVKLKKIEERFCRQLDKPDLWPAIHEQVLSDASPRITKASLLILDLGDIIKKYATHMEYLATVRDGSEGELACEHWTLQVIAASVKHQAIVRQKSRREKVCNPLRLICRLSYQAMRISFICGSSKGFRKPIIATSQPASTATTRDARGDS